MGGSALTEHKNLRLLPIGKGIHSIDDISSYYGDLTLSMSGGVTGESGRFETSDAPTNLKNIDIDNLDKTTANGHSHMDGSAPAGGESSGQVDHMDAFDRSLFGYYEDLTSSSSAHDDDVARLMSTLMDASAPAGGEFSIYLIAVIHFSKGCVHEMTFPATTEIWHYQCQVAENVRHTDNHEKSSASAILTRSL
ncbi:uncharacterized protein EDB91DRAFT_1088769 [Suillus paluster]|uniref:uncharacterized protein n=1 Tax=Suillus paluster TaxID=48578 RepID=UPI001B871249|nr:uncharacterized protein EDB91DRAFT_1088769 [Suillus paluster]KAG1720570.1 hypothetical protein EDB91DRAFT_1088769 [Suillus paluster]